MPLRSQVQVLVRYGHCEYSFKGELPKTKEYSQLSKLALTSLQMLSLYEWKSPTLCYGYNLLSTFSYRHQAGILFSYTKPRLGDCASDLYIASKFRRSFQHRCGKTLMEACSPTPNMVNTDPVCMSQETVSRSRYLGHGILVSARISRVSRSGYKVRV